MSPKSGPPQSRTPSLNEIEIRFLKALRHHILGLKTKVEKDFGKESFAQELANLKGDPIYPKFGFDCPEYVLVRFMGRMSISIGRRLGEIYDKIPRFVAAARFGLTPKQVSPLLNGLELDIALKFANMQPKDQGLAKRVGHTFFPKTDLKAGFGIEIRYNFNPNDSSRLRKDVEMAGLVLKKNLLPVYLIFSSISPREEAIARLQRGGWKFLIGNQAIDFLQQLVGLDLSSILDKPAIKQEVIRDMGELMNSMIGSYSFREVLSRYNAQKPLRA